MGLHVPLKGIRTVHGIGEGLSAANSKSVRPHLGRREHVAQREEKEIFTMRQKLFGSNAKALVALGASLCVLTACSSGVVEEAAEQTVAPLSRTAAPSTQETTSAATDTKADSAKSSKGAESEEPSAMQDKAAGEVSAIPERQPQLADADQRYLEDLHKAGINTDGIEDELRNVAQVKCFSEDEAGFGDATVQAIAGQLIEQKRAEGSFEEVSAAIAQAAQNAYC